VTSLERFLHAPGRLLQAAPTPAGATQLEMELPGASVLLSGLPPATVELFEEAFPVRAQKSASSPETPHIRVYAADRDQFRPSSEIDWSDYLAIDYAEDAWLLGGYRWMGRIRRGLDSAGEVWMDPSESGSALEDLWENFLRIFLARLFFENGGLLLHSACVVGATGAVLFPGQSGDGKSTLSELCRREGKHVLSDDCNAVFPGETDRWKVVGLPFGGDMRPRRVSDQSYDLRAILKLQKGGPQALESLSGSEAAAQLIRCSPFVNGDPCLSERLTSRVLTLLSGLKYGRLRFRREGHFWPIVEDFCSEKSVR